MIRHIALLTLALVPLAGCDGETPPPTDAGPGQLDAGTQDAGPPPFAPDSFCPGAPGCAAGEGGTFEVGAARASITPTIDERTDVMTLDVNGNGTFDTGDEFADRDGEPGFQGVWIAGFGNARPASDAHDDVHATAVALRNADTTIVLVALDVIGWFRPDMERIRELVADLAIDHVAISSTHVHQNRDTIGIWGISADRSGRSEAYNEHVRQQAARAIRDAVAALRPAHVQYADVDLRTIEGGPARLVGDLRDPIILDPFIRLMRFVDASDDSTIATVVNFAAHPEYLGSRNTRISGDVGHFLRAGIEAGVPAPDGAATEGVGGITLWMNGAVGGQIGPNQLDVRRWDGTPVVQRDDVWEFTRTVGEQLAYHCLRALGPDGGSVTDETAALGYRTRSFFVPVQNTRFHLAIVLGLFDREGHNWDPRRALIPDENQPDLLTEVTVIDVGRATMITAPGELEPELFHGGYDGAYTPPTAMIVDPANPNPPALDRAPAPPYLRDLARSDATQVWLLGMTNDYLGYLMGEYNYVLSSSAPYFDEADGDHYEETNSVGVDGWPTIRRELEALLTWSAE
ncbi:MAG: hypothetical protein KF729_18480 [Sandaracinaceae bacterium]|nr:hypothetical protein [Sandaracinaceae bacterium]